MDIVEQACKVLGIEPRISHYVGVNNAGCMFEDASVGRDKAALERWMEEHKDYCKRLGYSLQKSTIYPTGDDALKAIKAKLREKGCSYTGGWDSYHKCHFIDFLQTPEGKTIITDESWESTKAETELEALCKAVVQMGRAK